VSGLPIQPGTIEAFGLYAARCAALIVGAPLFGAPTGFMAWRSSFVVILAAVLYAAGGQPLATSPAPIEYALLVLREVVVGLALAFCLHGALLAVRTAAEMVSHEIGLSYANLVDPTSGGSTSSMALFYEVFFYLGLLLTDGHHVLLRAVSASFESAPVGRLALDTGVAESALSLVGQMLVAGLTFAAPVLVLLFATSLLVALLGRAVPQLNVNETGFTLRTALGLLALFVFAPTMTPALNGLYAALFDAMQDAVGHLGA
jgi:flagellar biosynthetic protein FliR